MPSVSDLWLDNRDHPGLVAQRREAGQRVRVGPQCLPRRDSFPDQEDRAPPGEAGAEKRVLREALPQPVQALGDLLARRPGERLRPGVHLDAGEQPAGGECVREGLAVVKALPECLVAEDDAAHPLGQVRRGNE